MRIKRVQVEEGFLDGLDISFAQGLNVIIGERGTGKTSLIELIRFCLGVQGYTAESARRSTAHAISVLGSGQISITLTDGERDTLVTRTTADNSQRATGPYTYPIIFSQTEIEAVGLQAQGRVRLVDGFSGDQRETRVQESATASEVRSLTTQSKVLRREIDGMRAQLEKIPSLDKQIADLVPQEQRLANFKADTKGKKGHLDTISDKIASAAVRIAAIDRFLRSVTEWRASLSAVVSSVPIFDPWPRGAGPDALQSSRQGVDLAKDQLNRVLVELESVESSVKKARQGSASIKIDLEERARQLRRAIDTLQDGTGVILRRGQQLREQRAELEALKGVLADRQMALDSIIQRRSAALDRLESIREERFRTRSSVAARLTETLGPSVRVEVLRAGQYEAYAAAVAEALRGSGLRYNELSLVVAPIVSPRELVEAVDTNDFGLIAETTGITRERAARVLGQLRDADLGTIATVAVEDAVALQLLDGAGYKGFGELSTGQRCTVVLPLVLLHTDRVVIVDQPEDHIDNAFIADTLIVSVLRRSNQGQLIFSTHNANIPVLGSADRVIQLGSDGRRGFSILEAPLEDPQVVKAITSVMEGGADAFERRVKFYNQNRPQ